MLEPHGRVTLQKEVRPEAFAASRVRVGQEHEAVVLEIPNPVLDKLLDVHRRRFVQLLGTSRDAFLTFAKA